MRKKTVVASQNVKLPVKLIQDSFIIDTNGDHSLRPEIVIAETESKLDFANLQLPPAHRLHPDGHEVLCTLNNEESWHSWLDGISDLNQRLKEADQALRIFPQSTRILILRMEAAAAVYPDPKPLLPIWQQVVEAYSGHLDVWMAFLRWYVGCSLFHFDQYFGFLRICFHCFLDHKADRDSVWAMIVSKLWDAGYSEHATAIIQACWGNDYLVQSKADCDFPDACIMRRWMQMERAAESDFIPSKITDEVDFARVVLKEDIDAFIIDIERENILGLAFDLRLPQEFLTWMAKQVPPNQVTVAILLEAGENPKELLKPFRSNPKHPAWLVYARHLQSHGVELEKARQIWQVREYNDFAKLTRSDWQDYADFERNRGIVSRFRRNFAISGTDFLIAIDFELQLKDPFYSANRVRSLFERAPPAPDIWLRWIQWVLDQGNSLEAKRLLFRGATQFAASKRFLLAALELVTVSSFEFANLITNAESRGLRIRTMLEEVAPIEDFCR